MIPNIVAAASTTATTSHGYLHDLLVEIGLSEFQANTIQFVVERPLKIGFIALGAWLIAHVGGRTVARSVRSLAKHAPERLTTGRGDLRTETLAVVMARLFRMVVAVVATLLVLGAIGLDLTPLLAGAGVLGIAVALGTQSIVRDMVAGLFIIGEDHYGVGDMIDINGLASGVVEDVSLRATRLRASDGTVWFISNGQILRVGNASLEFNRAVVDVPLTYGVDLARVREVAVEEAAALAEEEEWADQLLAAPEVWGVQALDPAGPTLRLVVKTLPEAQGPVGRELRLRIVDRLSREGLRPATA